MASYSPDHKPVDKLQERVYRTRIRDVDHLVERLVEEWSSFDHEIISAAFTQWQARLRPCVKAEEDILITFYDNWWMITLLHWK